MSSIVLRISDWVFDVDVAANMEFSAAQATEHCDCGYCRNFYGSIDGSCPNLRPFMAQFGINIEGPDELCPFEPTIYEVSYIVNGSILHSGEYTFRIDDIPVTVKSSSDADMDTERPEPYFVFVIGLMELPWILDEPMDEVVSPANEEPFLQRMANKLMARMEDTEIYS